MFNWETFTSPIRTSTVISLMKLGRDPFLKKVCFVASHCWKPGITIFECPFSKSCRQYLCPALQLPTWTNYFDSLNLLKLHLDEPFFMEMIIILSVWAIWNTTSAKIFKGVRRNLCRCRAIFKEELRWLKFRAKRNKYMLSGWVDSFI
jgi:hypothetical protein